MSAMFHSQQPITIEVGPGELLDKISILEIKCARIANPAKLANIRVELASLLAVRDGCLPQESEWQALATELKMVNERLWDVEDELRQCEQQQQFGPRFVELARAVYFTNDRRAALKRALNEQMESRIVEEKQYVAYAGNAG